MVVKVIARGTASFGQLLKYMQSNEKHIGDRSGRSFVIQHNVKGNTIRDWTEDFLENEEYRLYPRAKNTKLTHEILSWSAEDKDQITLEKMEEMTREYINLRGIQGMYVAMPHFDDHRHVHICASALEYRTGMSMRMSKKEFQTLKKDIQTYQIERYPELTHSLVDHDRKERGLDTDREYQYKLRTAGSTHKEQLVFLLDQCFGEALSKEDFYEHVRSHGHEVYERGGKTTGVWYEGRKYRFNRLGFTQDRLTELDQQREKLNELTELRQAKSRSVDPGREPDANTEASENPARASEDGDNAEDNSQDRSSNEQPDTDDGTSQDNEQELDHER